MENIQFLNGSRFKNHANDDFIMSLELFEQYKDNLESPEFVEKVTEFINSFTNNQLPRLKELKRYYLSDNNIKYRNTGRDKNRADNKIASDWAKYITTFMQGYILGNPVKYINENTGLLEKMTDFQDKNNEDYHNGLLETDLSIYGRAYELLYMDEAGEAKLTKLLPENTFVVYDDTIAKNSLFGVRFYQIRYSDTETHSFAEVYTDNLAAFYNCENDTFNGLEFNRAEETRFEGVPINEFRNNDERTGDYEAVLDTIDAYDLSQSELANFQQDMNDAYLVIVGNPITGTAPEYLYDDEGNVKVDEYGVPLEAPNSKDDVLSKMLKARLLVLDNNNDPDGPNPNAFYLTKEYDSTGAEAYKKRLVDDILRFTFTPDTSDQNFAGTQSGEAMKYKLMGNDNLTKTKIRLLTKGLMRRLRLLSNIWDIKNKVATSGQVKSPLIDTVNGTTIQFTPNIPQNDDTRVSTIKQLYGVVSDETLLDLLASFTGVDPDDELKRLKEEKESKISNSSTSRSFPQLQSSDQEDDVDDQEQQ